MRLLRLLLVPLPLLVLACSQAFAQGRLPMQALELNIGTTRNDRVVGTMGQLKLGTTIAQHIELQLEGSADSLRWERIAERMYYFVPNQAVGFRFGAARNPKHRYYRLSARDPQYRTLSWSLPPLRLTNAVQGIRLERPDAQTALLTYELARVAPLLLRVYNGIGQEVETRALPHTEAGHHTFPLDCRQYRSGIYLLVITQVDTNHKVAELRLEL